MRRVRVVLFMVSVPVLCDLVLAVLNRGAGLLQFAVVVPCRMDLGSDRPSDVTGAGPMGLGFESLRHPMAAAVGYERTAPAWADSSMLPR